MPFDVFAEFVVWNSFRAVAWNLPPEMPGVYLITHLASGKVYVGVARNLSMRLYCHAHNGSPTRLKRAISKHGLGAFLIQPIFVSFSDDPFFLLSVEEALIAEWDAIKNGYNLVERDGRLGPVGPAFAAHQREVCSRPETRARRSVAAKKRMKNPEHRAWFIAAGREYWLTEEGRRLNSQRRTEKNQDPELEAKRLAGLRAYQQRPDVIAELEGSGRLLGLRNRGTVHITNGIVGRRIPAKQKIPEGWRHGRPRIFRSARPKRGESPA